MYSNNSTQIRINQLLQNIYNTHQQINYLLTNQNLNHNHNQNTNKNLNIIYHNKNYINTITVA